MEYTTVFSVTKPLIPWLQLFMLLFCLTVGFVILRFPRQLKALGFVSLGPPKMWGWFMIGYGGFLSSLFLYEHYEDRERLRDIYTNGPREMQEGIVTELGPRRGYAESEGFKVNGVEFVYSPYEYTGAYNTPSSSEGSLLKNGSRVRVFYFRDDRINRILRLDVAVPKR